jgi:hypothetical protein
MNNIYIQEYFCDGTCRNTVPEVLSQKAASRNGVPGPFSREEQHRPHLLEVIRDKSSDEGQPFIGTVLHELYTLHREETLTI